MKIIVDGGATKADWCAVAPEGLVKSVKTAGINVATMPPEAISAIADEAVEGLDLPSVESIHFYMAGLVSDAVQLPENVLKLDERLCRYYPDAVKEYKSDLYAAARSVCGHEAGIAGILGTGSNSCFYDGDRVSQKVRSGGFIVGDEGSGAVLGKLFIADFLKNRVPAWIAEDFASRYESDYGTIVQNVYRSSAPSKYLGQFAPYILSFYGKDDYITELVEGNFRAFVERMLKQYDTDRYQVGVVGGFGYATREILRKVGAACGVTFSRILAAPLEGLIDYHKI